AALGLGTLAAVTGRPSGVRRVVLLAGQAAARQPQAQGHQTHAGHGAHGSALARCSVAAAASWWKVSRPAPVAECPPARDWQRRTTRHPRTEDRARLFLKRRGNRKCCQTIPAERIKV